MDDDNALCPDGIEDGFQIVVHLIEVFMDGVWREIADLLRRERPELGEAIRMEKGGNGQEFVGYPAGFLPQFRQRKRTIR